MSDFEQLYCPEPSCDDPDNPGFPRPVDRLGYCATHRRQLQRTGKVSPIAERLNPEERVIETASRMVETEHHQRRKPKDTNDDRAIEAAAQLVEADDDDEDEYNRRRRALLVACRALGQTAGEAEGTVQSVEKVRAEYREARRAAALKGLDRARRQGKRIGRPLKTGPTDIGELVERVFAETRSVSATARALGIDRKTVRARLGKKAPVTPQLPALGVGPRQAG